jgi:hypothetical protein
MSVDEIKSASAFSIELTLGGVIARLDPKFGPARLRD